MQGRAWVSSVTVAARGLVLAVTLSAAVAVLPSVSAAGASGGGAGSGQTVTSAGSGGSGGGGTGGGGGAGGGAGGGGGTGGGGGGRPALPLLISQAYTLDTNADGTVSLTDGTDTICRTDGFLYASTGTSCLTDRFTTDLQGNRQMVYTGEVGQPWVDKLNAWYTDPARRDVGKPAPVSVLCLTNLYVVDATVQPSEAGLNPACLT